MKTEKIEIGYKKNKEKIAWIDIETKLTDSGKECTKIKLYIKADKDGLIPKKLRNPFISVFGERMEKTWGYKEETGKNTYRYREKEIYENEELYGYERAIDIIDNIIRDFDVLVRTNKERMNKINSMKKKRIEIYT